MITFLEKINFGGYKSISNVSVTFQKGLNIIIGPNGSGKTNFLEFLIKSIGGYAHDLDQFNVDLTLIHEEEDNLFQSTPHRVKSSSAIKAIGKTFKRELTLKYWVDNSIAIDEIKKVDLDEDINRFFEYYLINKKLPRKFHRHYFEYQVPDDLVFLSKPGQYRFMYDWGMIHGLPDKRSTIFERYVLDVYAWQILEKLKKQSKSKSFKPTQHFIDELKGDFLKGSEESLKNKLSVLLSEYTHISDVRVLNTISTKWVKNESVTIGDIILEFKIENEWYRWDSLSDGTRRLLLMISSIHSYESGIMFVEEPELGIHPHQLDKLMRFLKEESDSKQIIITTHSPQVLDILEESEIDRIIIAQYIDNQTSIKNINEDQIGKALAFTKESFLSDFWRHTDELRL